MVSSFVGVGGANLDGPGCTLIKRLFKYTFTENKRDIIILINHSTYLVESFIRARATLFSSTKANGKMPILSNSLPSAQFSSTLLITLMTSP